mmetsp:Transcript_3663/g.12775  ORF Transcript_3663/g.12775 Transcript_3663/m.12775 type:complete len:353 (-) Transcript_3663:143-1201(-)
MSRAATVLLALAAVGCASASRPTTGASGLVRVATAEHESAFAEFVAKYEKVYAGDAAEYARRLEVFAANVRRAEEHQRQDPTATHGVTQFSDLTPEEFQKHYTGLLQSAPDTGRLAKAEALPTNDLPATFDWREKGAVTGVKNQGMCGSCWAFSTTGAVEGAHFLKTGKLVSLSEQELVDCDHECEPSDPRACDAGCGGGLPSNAMEYIMENGGLDTEESYPYKGFNGKCDSEGKTVGATVSNFTIIDPDEDQIAAKLVASGPLSIGINAEWMQTYVGGVSCPYLCNKRRLDHGVLIVGYGQQEFAPARLGKKDFWIIKNSWGAGWGEEGYIKVCRGQGMCGLNTMVVSAEG